jgi:hypothetical protein
MSMKESQRKPSNAATQDTGIYVGPEWIRVDGRIEVRPAGGSIGEETVHRATNRNPAERELRQSFYWFFVPAMIALASAAWLFQVIWEGLRP